MQRRSASAAVTESTAAFTSAFALEPLRRCSHVLQLFRPTKWSVCGPNVLQTHISNDGNSYAKPGGCHRICHVFKQRSVVRLCNHRPQLCDNQLHGACVDLRKLIRVQLLGAQHERISSYLLRKRHQRLFSVDDQRLLRCDRIHRFLTCQCHANVSKHVGASRHDAHPLVEPRHLLRQRRECWFCHERFACPNVHGSDKHQHRSFRITVHLLPRQDDADNPHRRVASRYGHFNSIQPTSHRPSVSTTTTAESASASWWVSMRQLRRAFRQQPNARRGAAKQDAVRLSHRRRSNLVCF